MFRLRSQGAMQTHDVGMAKDRFDVGESNLIRVGSRAADGHHHLHVTSQRHAGDRLGNVSKTNQSHGQPADFHEGLLPITKIPAASPVTAMNRFGMASSA